MVKSMEHGWTRESDKPESESWFSYILVRVTETHLSSGSSSTKWE